MKKALKITAIAVGVTLALLLIAIVVLVLTFDPNQYKGQITKLVKDATGRELNIEGDISLSFFPWLGADLGALSLSNAPGFGKDPMLRVQGAGIKVKLMPLFRKEVEIDKIYLDGLKLQLAKNAQGKTNWEDLGGAEEDKKPTDAPQEGEPAVAAFGIGGVKVNDGEVVWDDRQAGSRYVLQKLNLNTGALAAGKPVDVDLDFDLESTKPAFRTPVKLDARVALDLDKQTLDIPQLVLELLGLKVKVDELKGSKIVDAPSFTGKLDIPSFNAKAVLKQIGSPIDTADSAALTKLAVNTPFSASTQALDLKNLAIALDESKIQGSFALQNFDAPTYRFTINIDDLDLDRYLPPEAPAEKKKASAFELIPSAHAASASEPVTLPLSTLRELKADGSVSIGKLKATGIRSTEVSAKLSAQGGVIKLAPSKAKLYGGSYQGAMGIDARGKEPILSMDEQLKAVQVGPLLKDMQVFDNFTGVGDIALKLNGRGLDAKQITRSLNGNVAVSLRDGTIEGADLIKQFEEAEALVKTIRDRQPVPTKGRKGDKTAFEVLSATGQVTNGVVQSNDLLLKTPGIRATGRGSANLVNETLDFRLEIMKNKDEGKACASIPFRVSGPFDGLSYLPDLEAYLKCKGQEKLQKKVEEKKEELDQKLKEKGLDLLFKKRKTE